MNNFRDQVISKIRTRPSAIETRARPGTTDKRTSGVIYINNLKQPAINTNKNTAFADYGNYYSTIEAEISHDRKS